MLTPLDREWHERRLDGFGGSEVGALLGISPWQTARTVVERKARRIIQDPDAPERLRLRLGREMEPILLEHLWEALSVRHGSMPRPRRSGLLHRMPGHSFVTSDVDGFIGDALVECKTDEYGSLPWGDPEGDPARAVPAPYYAQVQQGLAATGRKRAFVIVLIGLHDELIYEVPRRDEYIADLVEVEAIMWAQVLAIRERLANDPDAPIEDLLPPLEGEALTEQLKKDHPRSTELIRQAVTAEDEQLLRDLRAARARRREAEAAEDVATAKVQALIAEAAGVTGAEGTITWRTSEDRTTTAWDLVAASYRSMLNQVHEEANDVSHLPAFDASPERLDAIRTMYTSTTPGSRRFVVPRAWDR